MPCDAAVHRPERIAAEFNLAEDGAQAEAQNVRRNHRLHEQTHQHRAGDHERLAGVDRGDGRADPAQAHQCDHQQQKQVAHKKQRDAAIARSRLRP